MRGEHLIRPSRKSTRRGSSPHARGTLPAWITAEHGIGIIPACAGNTSSLSGGIAVMRDHPRMRGEHITYALEGATSQGSSPHARGTLGVGCCGLWLLGIIPACAGNTTNSYAIVLFPRDHPRMRGEHSCEYVNANTTQGSSPLARGTRRRRSLRLQRLGIIPACAGNTAGMASCPRRGRDHPRMRGEHK